MDKKKNSNLKKGLKSSFLFKFKYYKFVDFDNISYLKHKLKLTFFLIILN